MPKVLVASKADPGKTKLVSGRDAKVLVKMGRWDYVTTALEGGPPKRRKRAPKAAPAAAESAAPAPTEQPAATQPAPQE